MSVERKPVPSGGSLRAGGSQSPSPSRQPLLMANNQNSSNNPGGGGLSGSGYYPQYQPPQPFGMMTTSISSSSSSRPQSSNATGTGPGPGPGSGMGTGQQLSNLSAQYTTRFPSNNYPQ